MWHDLRAALVRQARTDHPDKVRGRSDDELQDYVQAMLQFAASFRLERTPSIQRLVDLQLRHDFSAELDAGQRHPLEQHALDEAERLDGFERALRQAPGLKVIDLDTPITATDVAGGWR